MLEEARAEILEQQWPAEPSEIAMWLTRLDALTARQGKTEIDLELMIQAYIDKLSAYPADAIEAALDNLADKSKWFPAWAEIQEELDWLTRRRRFIVAELDRKIDRLRPDPVMQLIRGGLKDD